MTEKVYEVEIEDRTAAKERLHYDEPPIDRGIRLVGAPEGLRGRMTLLEQVLSSAKVHRIDRLSALLRIDDGYLSLTIGRVWPETAHFFCDSVESKTRLRVGVTYKSKEDL